VILLPPLPSGNPKTKMDTSKHQNDDALEEAANVLLQPFAPATTRFQTVQCESPVPLHLTSLAGA
jgi:hypothetical protein